MNDHILLKADEAVKRRLENMKDFDPYKFVQERKTPRPFNEKCERDGNWNYVHETDVWALIERIKYENNKNTLAVTCACTGPREFYSNGLTVVCKQCEKPIKMT